MEAAATIAGKYTLVRKVGASSIAEVYLARFAGKDGKVDQVLLRRVLADLAKNEQFTQLFAKVTSVMSALAHPNVLRILEVGDDPAANGRFTVTEFIQGQTLRRVQEAARRKGGLHLAHALGVVLDLARGLHYAHEMKDANGYSIGIVHGDVAPGNVVLGYDGIARIQDFGMMWVEAAVPANDPTLLTEKFPYMSPERVAGAPLDRRSDLFSLALVLYELVTGVPAFQAASPKELMARIMECKFALPSTLKEGFPVELENALARALARVPEQRFPTCEAFAKALQEVMDRRNLSTSPALLGSYLRGLFGAGAVVEPGAAPPPAAAPKKVMAPGQLPAKEKSADPARGAPSRAKTVVDSPDPLLDPGARTAVASQQARPREPLRPTPSRPPWSADLEAQKAEITQAKVIAAEKQVAAKKEADAAAVRKAEAEKEAAQHAAQQAEDLIERRASMDREGKARREAEAELRNQVEREIAARKAAEDKADAAIEREAQARREAEEAAERDAASKKAAEDAAAGEFAAKALAEEAATKEAAATRAAEEATKASAVAKKAAEEALKSAAAAKKAAERDSAAKKAAEELLATESAARKAAEERAETLRTELETARAEATVSRKKADDTARQMAARTRDLSAKQEADANDRELSLRHELDLASDREAALRKEADAALEKESLARASEAAAKKAAQEALGRETALQKVYADLLERLDTAERDAETAKAEAKRLVDETRGEALAKLEIANTTSAAAARKMEAAQQQSEAAMRESGIARADAEAARRELSAGKRDADAAKRAAATVRKKWETAEAENAVLKKELEAARLQAEQARKEQEPLRQNAESVRRQTEAARRLADAVTEEAEAAKRVAEAATQEAEAARRESEVHRQEAEAARGELDALRLEMDALRLETDALRAEMEALREDSETVRQQADAAREAGDAARIQAETMRQEAEAIREQAEAARQEAEAVRMEAIAAAETGGSGESAENGNGGRIGVSQVALYLSAFADAPRTNLTADPGNFIGREEAILSLDLLLREDAPVFTLVGADGSGRTRLARRFASTKLVELSQEGGAWYVDLSEVRDAEGICHAVATALGIALVPSMGEVETVKHVGSALAGRGRLLLVLDGIDRVADVLSPLLDEWSALATSARFLLVGRAPIGLRGERTRAIGALGLPTPASPIESEAMALFITRARERRRQQGAGAEAGLPVIAKIVRLLEGNPLAIELVAARAEVAAPAKLHADLAKAIEQNERKAAGIVEKVLDWVWAQLSRPEQAALGQCALFHGGFTTEAAEDVIDLSAHSSAPAEHEVLRSLRVRGLIGGEDLLPEMHPSIRAFALAKLEKSGEIESAAARHTARTLRAGRSAAKELERVGSRDALRRLQLETGNVLAVFERALGVTPQTASSATQALEAVQCLAPAVDVAGPFELGLGWMDAALAAAGKLPVDKRLRAEILLSRGRLRRARGDVKGSTGDLYDAHDIAAVGDDRGFESAVLADVGLTLQAKGKIEEGKKALEQALNLARLVKDGRREAHALTLLGALHDAAGRTTDAASSYQEAAAVAARCGARRAEGAVYAALGALLQQSGDLEGARGILEKALGLHQEVRDRGLEAATAGRLATVALEDGQYAAGRDLFVRAITLQQERGARTAEAALRGKLGILEQLDGRVEDAREQLVKAIWTLGDIGEAQLEGLYLAFLAGLVSSMGTLDTGAESFDLAKRQLSAANDAPGLEALELLMCLFDVEKARQAGDRAAAEAVRLAAVQRADQAAEEGDAEFVRLARRVVKDTLSSEGSKSTSRSPAQGRA